MIKKMMHEAGIDKLFELNKLIESNSDSKDVDWVEVEAYIEKGREERLLIPEENYC